MQCSAFWRCRLNRCASLQTVWIVSNQGKATQPRASAFRSRLYTIAKYKTCQKGGCRCSEVCETKNHVGTWGCVSTWHRPWIQTMLPIPIRIYQNGNGHNNRELTAKGVVLWKNQSTQNTLARQSSLMQVSNVCKKITQKVESLSLRSKKQQNRLGKISVISVQMLAESLKSPLHSSLHSTQKKLQAYLQIQKLHPECCI